MVLRAPDTALPWASSEQEDNRFRRILRNSLLVFVVFAVAVPFLPVPEISREEKETLPPQLARVMLEEQALPEPKKPEPKPEPEEKKEPEPEKEKPEPEPEPEKQPEPQEVDVVKQAREKAASAGVMAFQDDLAAMRDSVDVDDLANQNLTRADDQAAKVERSIITSKAKASSGGIETAKLSRNTGGAALSGKEDTQVSSDFDKIAAREQGGSAGSAAAGGRSDEDIRRVMDKNKGAIFAIYNRALRRDPTLQGKFVFEMLIQPDGSISEVKLVSSDLNNDDLESKILNRVRLIRFPAQDVIATRVNYSFDFLPY